MMLTSNRNQIRFVRNCCTWTSPWPFTPSTSLHLHNPHFLAKIYLSLNNVISFYVTSLHFNALHFFIIYTPLSLRVVYHFPNETNKTNSLALSPRNNYTDWATATCRRNLVTTFVDRGVSRGQRGGSPTVVNLSFLDRSLSCFPKISSLTGESLKHLQAVSSRAVWSYLQRNIFRYLSFAFCS
jgi:hypothetical protein